jgi:predicted metal-dependent enzyme (double-stranded beta helix superfamily)
VIDKVSRLAQKFVTSRELWWNDKFYQIHPEKGFETHILHHEADHTLAVIVVAWDKGRCVPPHNHGSWSVVCGVEGREQNTLWERSNPELNNSPLKEVSKTIFTPGEIASFCPDTIHSVENLTDGRSVSLHIYGWHVPGGAEFWIYPNGDPDSLDKYQPNKDLQHFTPPI